MSYGGAARAPPDGGRIAGCAFSAVCPFRSSPWPCLPRAAAAAAPVPTPPRPARRTPSSSPRCRPPWSPSRLPPPPRKRPPPPARCHRPCIPSPVSPSPTATNWRCCGPWWWPRWATTARIRSRAPTWPTSSTRRSSTTTCRDSRWSSRARAPPRWGPSARVGCKTSTCWAHWVRPSWPGRAATAPSPARSATATWST